MRLYELTLGPNCSKSALPKSHFDTFFWESRFNCLEQSLSHNSLKYQNNQVISLLKKYYEQKIAWISSSEDKQYIQYVVSGTITTKKNHNTTKQNKFSTGKQESDGNQLLKYDKK